MNSYEEISREGLVDMLEEATDKIKDLHNFIRTRNVVCTWCGYTVVYDNNNEEEKQAARDKVNAHSLVCEKDPRTIELKQIEFNYDALQSPMPCGHLARYAVNGEEGTQYCCMCLCETVTGTTDPKIQAKIAEIINHD